MDLTRTAVFGNLGPVVVDLDAAVKSARKNVDAVNAANKKEPTPDDLKSECVALENTHEELARRCKQAEGTANRAADRVRGFENRLKTLKEACSETDLTNYKAKRGWYNAAASRIAECEQDLVDAKDFFNRMKAISVDAAKNLKAWEKQWLKRLEELKPIVAKNDANYSFIKGTSRTRGWGRW